MNLPLKIPQTSIVGRDDEIKCLSLMNFSNSIFVLFNIEFNAFIFLFVLTCMKRISKWSNATRSNNVCEPLERITVKPSFSNSSFTKYSAALPLW